MKLFSRKWQRKFELYINRESCTLFRRGSTLNKVLKINKIKFYFIFQSPEGKRLDTRYMLHVLMRIKVVDKN